MKYTIEINRQVATNTFESMLVVATEDHDFYYSSLTKLIMMFASDKTLNNVSFKEDENFLHANIYYKLN